MTGDATSDLTRLECTQVKCLLNHELIKFISFSLLSSYNQVRSINLSPENIVKIHILNKHLLNFLSIS